MKSHAVKKSSTPLNESIEMRSYRCIVKDATIEYVEKRSGKRLIKTYPSEHAVRVIAGRLRRKDEEYLKALLRAIRRQGRIAGSQLQPDDEPAAETTTVAPDDHQEDAPPAMAASAPDNT